MSMEQNQAQATADMSDEQRKRLDLIEAYEADTGPDREARNTALAALDRDFEAKWIALRSEIEMKREESIEKWRAEGRTDEQVQSLVATEIAAITEQHMQAKDTAARQLDLATPKSWQDWLQEKQLANPDDPTFDSLIDEARRSPPALDGYLKNPPPRSVVSDLVPSPASDGRVDYMRGMLVALTDTGSRLDVKRNDDRDIEAGLKIAAQKFDMDKGLMLTGDLAFKRRAAEIAGRLGYKLQNQEPEVLLAYKRGQEQQAKPEFARVPSVANGIEGDAIDRAVAVLKGPMIISADPHTIKVLENTLLPGIEATSAETVVIPGERVWQAQAEIRELPADVLPVLAQIDISKDDGGLTPEQIAVLEKENQGLIENGKLTQKTVDIVLVRDDRVIRSREALTPEQREMFGVAYKTSGDHLREQAADPEQAQDKQQQHEVGVDMDNYHDFAGLAEHAAEKTDEAERARRPHRKRDVELDR
ncbi:hypothetical protein MASR1M60_22620 [Rhodocyclaceae bacterium]